MTYGFEDLIGMSRSAFESEYFGRRRLLSRAADTSRDFTQLLTLTDLDTILADQSLRAPLVWVVQQGKQITEGQYTTASAGHFDHTPGYIDSAKLYRCFRGGATVVFRQMPRYWQPVQDLCRQISQDIGLPVTRADGYITPHEAQGLLPHYDDTDVLVLQLSGRKEWFEYEHNGDLPLPQKSWMTLNAQALERERAKAVVSGSVVLEPGDVLYVPRGSMHAARTLDDYSLHIGLSLMHIAYLDVLEALTRCAVNDRWFRRSLPLGSGDAGAISSSAVAKEVAEHLVEFVSNSNPADAEWDVRTTVYAEAIRPAIKVFSQYEAARQINDDTVVTVRPDLVYNLSKVGDRIEIRTDSKRRVVIPAQATAAVESLLSGNDVRVADLPANLTTEERRGLVDTLLTENVITCR
jgi:hypothetical protein